MSEIFNKTMDMQRYHEYTEKHKGHIVELGLFDNLDKAVETLTLVEECPAKFGLSNLTPGEIIHLVEEFTPERNWSSDIRTGGFIAVTFKQS